MQHRIHEYGKRAIVGAFMLSAAQSHADTVVGGDSFGAECYLAAQVAISTGSADRFGLESCDRAIVDGGLKPKDLIASHVNRGVIHMAMGRPKMALSDLDRALELDGDTGEAYVNRGNLWFIGGNLTNAVADYDRAITLGVERPHVAHLNRGMANELLNRLEQAKFDYEASLTYLEDWSEAASRLVRVNEKIKKKKREQK